MRNLSPRWKRREVPYEDGATWTVISIVHLVVALPTRVTYTVQLNDINSADKPKCCHEAAKLQRPFSPSLVMRSWNICVPVNRAGVFIWARSTEIPVAETEISLDLAGAVLVWTHRNFYKRNSERVRSLNQAHAQDETRRGSQQQSREILNMFEVDESAWEFAIKRQCTLLCSRLNISWMHLLD